MIDPDATFTVQMAAEHLGVCTATVYRAVKAGDLGCVRRPGRGIRIKGRHINDYEAVFECRARVVPIRPSNSSADQSGANGMSASSNRGRRVANASARAKKTKRRRANG